MKKLPLRLMMASALVFAAVSVASAQIWRWVDEDGVLTFSNSPPPAHVRNAVPVISSPIEDANRKNSGPDVVGSADYTDTRVENHRSPENRITRWRNRAQSPPDSYGEVLVAENQTRFDVPDEAWEYDCGGLDEPYPGLISYTPYTDYTSSRRYRRGPHPRYRHHLRRHSRRHHFGYRRYDRHFYSQPYRYHSRAPRYHPVGRQRDHGVKTRSGHGRINRGRSGYGLRR